jgi:hypothetical protein
MSMERIDSSVVIPPEQWILVESRQKHELNKWKHVAATALVFIGFAVICAAMVLPYPFMDPFREKAWTLFTVLVSSAAAYLYSVRDENSS